MDLVTVDNLLTTTRSVRKRLDLERPLDMSVLERCLEIAVQSPSGSNQQKWHFVVVTDPARKKAIADLYRQSFNQYLGASAKRSEAERDKQGQMIDSAIHLAEHMHEVPALVLFCGEGRVENAGVAAQASFYGSILPAAWSFMLALRARGMGAAWTTLHLPYEKEVAALLGIPENVTQAALLPVAWYTGTDFKPAGRRPAAETTYWNQWGGRRA